MYSYFVDELDVINTSLSFQFEMSKPEIFGATYNNPEYMNVQQSKRDPVPNMKLLSLFKHNEIVVLKS